MKPNSYLLHENTDYIVVATGFEDDSANTKTGAMVQVWILACKENPLAALKSGNDSIVCGDCPLRGTNGKKRGCYVRVYQAPLSIWHAYNRGSYTLLTDYSVFDGRDVRFGAYGEPVLIPVKIVREIVSRVHYYTGYTHQWLNPANTMYQPYFMASTNEHDYKLAQQLGWRTFTVSARKLDGLVQCPASEEMGHRTTCDKCGLCNGTGSGISRAIKSTKSIQIQPHGAGAKFAA